MLWPRERDACKRDGGANLDLTLPAFVASIFWPLVVPPVRWHHILCTFCFLSGMITLVVVDT
jgi:hypothetical protein